jgi:membrane fusion protein (multidrug efflux system)
MKHLKIKIAAALLIALIAGIAYVYFSAATRSTENAYINADVVNVASQVAGRVSKVYVTDNQTVHKGDALFDIDPEPYNIALEKAEAELAVATQNARQDHAEIDIAKAQIAQAQSDLANARSILIRNKKLVGQHFLSQQALDDAQTGVLRLDATLSQARAKLIKDQAAPQNITERGDVLKAQAAINQAKLDLAHTHITATRDGQISNLTLTEGTMAGIATPLFALIEKDSFHIDANFKETQLSGIHPGQRVDIELDMYPDQHLTGSIESLSGATGTAFSLLPPQNATGNWVKIAQRVPVRIKFDPTDSELRIGATATVTVHLK